MKKNPFTLLAACGLLCSVASSATAQSLTGLGTGGNVLSVFSAPGATPTSYAITGTTGGESLIGIDYFSSSTGQLFGMGSSGTLYTLAPSGATTYAATVNVANAVPGATVIDFNPMANRLRVFAGTSNFRLTPGAGTTTADGTLTYNTGDAHFGATPALVGAAYTNNFAGPASTALYSLDSLQDTLVLNTGAPAFSGLSTVATLTLGGLTFDITTGTTGFDIRSLGGVDTAYVSKGNALYTVNLANGVLTTAGTLAGTTLIDIAFAPVPEPSTYALFAAGALLLGGIMLRRGQTA